MEGLFEGGTATKRKQDPETWAALHTAQTGRKVSVSKFKPLYVNESQFPTGISDEATCPLSATSQALHGNGNGRCDSDDAVPTTRKREREDDKEKEGKEDGYASPAKRVKPLTSPTADVIVISDPDDEGGAEHMALESDYGATATRAPSFGAAQPHADSLRSESKDTCRNDASFPPLWLSGAAPMCASTRDEQLLSRRAAVNRLQIRQDERDCSSESNRFSCCGATSGSAPTHTDLALLGSDETSTADAEKRLQVKGSPAGVGPPSPSTPILEPEPVPGCERRGHELAGWSHLEREWLADEDDELCAAYVSGRQQLVVSLSRQPAAPF